MFFDFCVFSFVNDNSNTWFFRFIYNFSLIDSKKLEFIQNENMKSVSWQPTRIFLSVKLVGHYFLFQISLTLSTIFFFCQIFFLDTIFEFFCLFVDFWTFFFQNLQWIFDNFFCKTISFLFFFSKKNQFWPFFTFFLKFSLKFEFYNRGFSGRCLSVCCRRTSLVFFNVLLPNQFLNLTRLCFHFFSWFLLFKIVFQRFWKWFDC